MIGAGQAGESLVRDLLRHRQKMYWPIGFIDDNLSKEGQELHGVRVLGRTQDIKEIVARRRVDAIFIAMPSANSHEMRRLVSLCEKINIPFQTLPGINNLASGKISYDSLREVSVEDLLGRDPVSLNWDIIRSNAEAKTVLVSGEGCSIGAELCRQVASLKLNELIVVEKNEFNLYQLEMEFAEKFPNLNVQYYLLDVNDRVGMSSVFQKHKIDIVFHAAAYKHVPMLENQLRVAVINNVFGTKVIAEESANNNVEKFILISTDKAVNPSNVMGATKRCAEIFCQNLKFIPRGLPRVP